MYEVFPIDFDLVATVLGVDRSTLPDALVEREPDQQRLPGVKIEVRPLDDAEWAIIEPYVPKQPIAKPGVQLDDRAFVGAALFFAAARVRGYGWALLPEEVFGCRTSRQKRWGRWVMAQTWERLALDVGADNRLSTVTRDGLIWLAADAAKRRESILAKRRERLTDCP